MKKTTLMHQAILLALYGAAALPVVAQVQAASGQAAASQDIPSVTVVGSRRTGNTSATETPVPVDIIPMSRAAEQGGQFDLAQTLTYISPSFNSTRQTGADGADLVDSAALRGLGSDQTLVLVNGKRRHTTALVNLFGARNRGNTGTDMNAIPLLAIKNVQVLRDGAAAQYGSDAIAGVINIEMKKSLGCESVIGAGQYTRHDGNNYLASAYCGVAVGDGVVGITGEYLDRGRSNRAEEGNPRIIGDTKAKNQTVYLNGEWNAGPGKLYATAGVQQRDASSAAFARGGVGSDDIPSRNSAAMYPNGFVPFINGDIDDRYATVGYRTQLGGWNSDFSQTYGYNRMDYTIANTLNASIANANNGISANSFNAGGFAFRQLTTNADFSRFYDGILGGMNAAFGFEYRNENYQIFAGEPGSYIDADGVGIGGNAGSQGFPGFQPGDAHRPQPPQHRGLYRPRNRRHDRTQGTDRRALRALFRLRLHRHRQGGCCLSFEPGIPAARLGQHRLPRAVAAAGIFFVDFHRLRQRRAARRGAGAQRRQGRGSCRHPAAERRKVEELYVWRHLESDAGHRRHG